MNDELKRILMQGASLRSRGMMATSKNRLSVNLEANEYVELQDLAAQHNVSMAWVGRQAIIRLLGQYKQREFQFPLPVNTQQTGARG